DSGNDEHRQAQRALAEDAARNIESDEELPSEDHPSSSTLTGDWQVNTTTTTDQHDALLEEKTSILVADLDRAGTPTPISHDRIRALVVDPDAPGRIQLIGELEKIGWHCQAATSGAQAIDLLSQLPFDVVFADVASPEIDGLQLCRAVKRSRRLAK